MQWKDMNISGTAVPASVQKEAFNAWTGRPLKTATTLMEELISAGCDEKAAYRCADRMLQKARRAKVITFEKGVWHPGAKTNPK